MATTKPQLPDDILTGGLTRSTDTPPKTIAVIGAGMAGLTAAQELTRAGHHVTIYEARMRPGGRICTHRAPFAPGLHGEAGADHIRDTHRLTQLLCKDLGLELRPHISHSGADGLIYYRGQRQKIAECNAQPATDPFPVAGFEHIHSGPRLWAEATAKLRSVLERDGEQGWMPITEYTGDTTVRGYLERQAWSDEAIVKYALTCAAERTLGESMAAAFADAHLHATTPLSEITGGMDRLPAAIFARLEDQILLGTQVTHITQATDQVIVTSADQLTGTVTARGYSHVIIALPVPPMRAITFTPHLSRPKRQAMAAVRYQDATRILIQYREPFWAKPPYGFTTGGTTATDLPVRRVCYPTHRPEGNTREILTASATWGDDATFWHTMTEPDALRAAARDIATIHELPGRELPITCDAEHGTVTTWGNDPYAGGGRLLYGPGDAERYRPALARPEDRLHFAGEHLGDTHGWIEGAVESGLSAAWSVHNARP